MKVICGLGNPGERYRLTRHNVGFRVIDLLADRWRASDGRVPDGAAVLGVERPEPVGRVVLVKPLKAMNLSGRPLAAALRHTNAEVSEDLLLILDDIDLPLGRMRLRRAGSAGGHNGLRDVIDALGTDEFARLRVGIGRSGDAVDHVLSTFKRAELELVAEVLVTAADAAETWLVEGVAGAMNAYNGVDLAVPPA